MNRDTPPHRRSVRPILYFSGLALALHAVLGVAPAAAAAPATPAAATAEVPVYRTVMPPPVTLSYRLRKSGWSGSGDLSWQPQGGRYQARLEGRVAGFKVMTWSSTGLLDAAGIAPVRFTDERRGKNAQTANFQRSSGRITYSGPANEFALVPGAQDRLSWMIQVAAIALGDPHRMAKGERISLFVSGARADADVWSFVSQGVDNVATSGGPCPAVRLLREPRKPRDTRVEVWLDPARHYLPVRARLTNVQENDSLELLLEELTASS